MPRFNSTTGAPPFSRPLNPSFMWELSPDTTDRAYEFYRHSYEDLTQVTGIAPDAVAGFYNRISHFDLNGSHLSFCEGSAQTLTRTWRETRLSDAEYIVISVPHQGLLGADFNGRTGPIALGDIVLAETGKPAAMDFDELKITKLMVPRALIPRSLLDQDLHGMVIGQDTPTGFLLSSHIQSLLQVAPYLSPDEASASVEATFTLLAAGLDLSRLTPQSIDALRRSVRQIALDHIDRHLLDPALTPDSIARHIGVSRSTLYNAFRMDGGIGRHIRDKRLDSVYRVLRRRRGHRPSIQDIAYAHGFNADTHFNRAFTQRFGLRPGEVSGREMTVHATADAGDLQTNLRRYLDVWQAG
ncbi:helix-turn-helix domain-containing protein [Asticcacaulis sp. YBE204]|uniref:helix-turn-helix domain-containing protein n=1 Tax=Asticcacaulis sp. YBE204 TaxID=1282363 RepID=UPI0003C3E824|nr:helix-turn-helix domain-containing protein [Asticcacaulis sp. YBE204]ESQ79963.1 hypothetical protein AEYBE204_08940 [Asticcacaulis sp. YBE204]